MADEEMQDVDTPRTASTSSDNESDEEQVELLVTGRERRKTAGNRYNRDAALEEAAEGEDEDEVALLFADQEGVEDEEFRSEASDEDDMSSSDDDDQGPNAGGEDMEGEKELQKQAKDDRAKKRKADLALTTTAGLRKRPRIDPTAPKTAPKKPSKKKERVTWLPDPDNANARSSLRKQTIAHREHTLARLKESEAQSKKYKALKEKRDREKARDAPKAMTQADRLAEAERTERRNAKSLNRWEAMEKRRNEEQAAKLAALKNRKLEGPVITWRSGKEKFRGPKYPLPPPKMEIMLEEGPKKRGRKSKAYHEHMAHLRDAPNHVTGTPYQQPAQSLPLQFQHQLPPMQQSVQQSPQTWLGPPPPPPSQPYVGYQPSFQIGQPHMPPPVTQPYPPPSTSPGVHGPPETPKAEGPSEVAQSQPSTAMPSTEPRSAPDTKDSAIAPDVAQHPPPAPDANGLNNPLLFGIHEYASMEPKSPAKQPVDTATITQAVPETSNEVVQTVKSEPDAALPASAEPANTQAPTAPPATETTQGPEVQPTAAHSYPAAPAVTAASHAVQPATVAPSPAPVTPFTPAPRPPEPMIEVVETAPVAPAPPSPEVPMEEGFMTRNLLILDDFDDLKATDRQTYGVFFNTRRSAKPSKHSTTLCPITLMPAKYRDPATGIGYANLYAYKVLQELRQHKYAWSSMLGCYIGRDGAPTARGCPEGFLAK